MLPANAQRGSRGLNADGDLLGGSNHSGGGGSTDRGNGWAVAVNIGYENPDKQLRDVYNAAPTFGLTVIKRLNNWMFSGGIDYRTYKPKKDVFMDDIFNITYSNFKGFGLYAGVAYDLPISDAFDIYAGANLGSVIVTQRIESEQFLYSGTTSVNYVGPKLGFNIAASSNITVGVEGRYGLNVTGFNSNTQTGTEVYKGFSAASVNLMLTYNF